MMLWSRRSLEMGLIAGMDVERHIADRESEFVAEIGRLIGVKALAAFGRLTIILQTDGANTWLLAEAWPGAAQEERKR